MRSARKTRRPFPGLPAFHNGGGHNLPNTVALALLSLGGPVYRHKRARRSAKHDVQGSVCVRWIIGISLVLASSRSFADPTPYMPADVAGHTALLIENSPYVMPTTSGDAEGVIGYSHGWVPDDIPVHPLYGYKITDPLSSQPKQKVVMIAGNHGFEHADNWNLQGAIDFWVSDDPNAVLLRRDTELYVYPMVNPDGRFLEATVEVTAQSL